MAAHPKRFVRGLIRRAGSETYIAVQRDTSKGDPIDGSTTVTIVSKAAGGPFTWTGTLACRFDDWALFKVSLGGATDHPVGGTYGPVSMTITLNTGGTSNSVTQPLDLYDD